MQKTRQRILDFLRDNGETTVDELSLALDNLTAVTVRHHLDVLRGEGLVAAPEIQHRDTPGRPRYVYRLTEKAETLFPNNVSNLAENVLGELTSVLNDSQINVIFEGVAARMAAEIVDGLPQVSLEYRLDQVVQHLSQQGYEASWERDNDTYILHTTTCPYRGIASENNALCNLDLSYISKLLGTAPERLTHLLDGEPGCSYRITDVQTEAVG